VSEELIVFAAVLALILCISHKVALRWLIVWIGFVLAAMPMAPLFRSVIFSRSGAALPDFGLAWPATLPRWDPVYMTDGLPVLSIEALWAGAVELGPIFLGGLLVSIGDARRRAIGVIFLVGLLIACSFRYSESKVYLDRFLFYGTSAGFMLAAAWIERLERNRGSIALPVWMSRAAGVILLVIPTMLGPAGYAARHIGLGVEARFREPYLPLPPGELRQILSVVGPREQVLTDATYAQSLVLAGFIVAAPVGSPEVVMVLEHEIPEYWRSHPDLNPQWLLLPADDPRLEGRSIVGEYAGYLLARRHDRRGGD
jgi:hypothetical protein